MLEALNLKNNAETRYRCQVSVYRTIGPLVIISVQACVRACVCGGGFLDISTAGVQLKRLHSFHIQDESEKHSFHI